MDKVKVVIADDSELFRRVLKETIEASGKVGVVGLAQNGQEAIDLVKRTQPDLLILDCEMPVMNGLECLHRIRAECPLPVFMLSSLTYEGAAVTIKALEYGAVDFLQKPLGGARDLSRIVGALVERIEVIVLQQRLKNIRDKYGTSASRKEKMAVQEREPPLSSLEGMARTVDLIAMGSSIGGIQAAAAIIPKLPGNIKPLVWVQHMPAGFTTSLAERLDSLSVIHVREAADGDILKEGTCYLAPGGVQMRVHRFNDGFKLKISGTQQVSSHCPSCDVLFDSVAEYFSANTVGVILSGMGDDGARGLEKMHQKGAFVIGQNERSCIVYGMPKMAFERGAVDIELDMKDIAEGIKKIGRF